MSLFTEIVRHKVISMALLYLDIACSALTISNSLRPVTLACTVVSLAPFH